MTIAYLLVGALVGAFVTWVTMYGVLEYSRCPHDLVRCTHGDEIIDCGYRRAVCLRCGRALKRPLPEPCSVTGESHDRGSAVILNDPPNGEMR